jgi:hypothetical protein
MIKSENCVCESACVACACLYDCENQQYLVEDGFIMSCDSCGFAGLVESDGWIGVLDNNGGCAVYCSEKCAGQNK